MTRLRYVGCGLVGIVALLSACSGSHDPSAKNGPSLGIGDGEIPGDSPGGASGTPGTVPAPSEAAGAASDGASSGAASGGNGTVPAGVLTAGSWDDNRNYDLFGAYLGNASALHGRPPIESKELDDAFALWSGARPARTTLDVSIVIDTTGSMADEIAYLSSEFLALHASIQAKYPSADQRWSLVAYKDIHDPYIVQWFDFRTDPNDFLKHLSALSADGGGDYPESPERALDVASRLAWRGDETAKLAFWVADAPHHDDVAPAMAQALRGLRDRGVHLYPVMASGADELTELTMREGAALTGGRLVFLTDDSGVGGGHAEPRLPCFFVTKLDKAVVRMIDIELSGAYREPEAADVLRTGGNPQSGRCTLSDGHVASVF